MDYEEDKKPMMPTFESYLKKIEKFLPDKGKLLDVGSATGFFLEIAKDKGWNVFGMEISEYAAEKSREKGLNVITGAIEDLGVGKYFDVITFWDVIEHLANARIALISAYKLLNDKGILAVCTPDSKSLVAKLFGRSWHSLIPPEHLIIFNRHNLENLLSECGFQVLFSGKIGKRFTFQYIMQIAANWLGSAFVGRAAKFLKSSFLGKLSLMINLRDNIFIIARKL